MLVLFAVGLFCFMGVVGGLKVACAAYGIALCLSGWVFVGVWLIVTFWK